MAEELADQLAAEASGQVAGDAIPQPQTDAPASDPAKPRSIRDDIINAVDTVKKDERSRDEQGKFAKTDSAAPKPAASVEAVKAPEAVAGTPPVQAQVPSGPPPGWSKESKALWPQLSPSLQADVIKREAEVSSGFKQKSEELNRYQTIEQVIAPRRQGFQRHGIQSDAQAVEQLFAWEEAIRSNPLVAIPALARQYGVDLSQFAPRSGDQPQNAPDLSAQMRPILDPIVQKINAWEATHNAEKQERINDEITTFSQGKPHFATVRMMMGQFLASGAATDLDDAYQKAIYAHPEVRTLILKEQQDKAVADAQKAAQDRASKARVAASSVRGSSPQGQAINGQVKAPKGQSIRDSLMEAVKETRASTS